MPSMLALLLVIAAGLWPALAAAAPTNILVTLQVVGQAPRLSAGGPAVGSGNAGETPRRAGETPALLPEQPRAVIGLLLPPEEAEAASLRAGARLAIEQANKTASNASLVVRGRVGQWGADGEEAARMVLDDGAQALIAPPSGAATHLALQVAGRTAIPVVSLSADSSVSQTGVPWMVRIVPTTVEEGRFLLESLNRGTASPTQWVALVPEGRAGREVARDLRQAAVTAKQKLARVWEVSSSLTNVDSFVTRVLKAQPTEGAHHDATTAPLTPALSPSAGARENHRQSSAFPLSPVEGERAGVRGNLVELPRCALTGVLVWLDPVLAGRFVRSLRQVGFTGKLAGPSRCNSPAFLAAAGREAEGFTVPGMVLDQTGEARFRTFLDAFRKRYGIDADLAAAESYDAILLLVHILKERDSQSLPRAFPLTFSLVGASGELRFDAEGNRKVPLQLLIVRDGCFGAVQPEREKPTARP